VAARDTARPGRLLASAFAGICNVARSAWCLRLQLTPCGQTATDGGKPANQGRGGTVNADDRLELGADVVARRLSTAEQIRHDTPGLRAGWVFLFLADARLLDRLAGGVWSVEDCADLAGRLEMVVA
jgi:hypothetical protein